MEDALFLMAKRAIRSSTSAQHRGCCLEGDQMKDGERDDPLVT